MRLDTLDLTATAALQGARSFLAEYGGSCSDVPFTSGESFVYPGVLGGVDIVVKVSRHAAAGLHAHALDWVQRAGDAVVAPLHGPVVTDAGVITVWPRGDAYGLYDLRAWMTLGALLGRLHHAPAFGHAVFDPLAGLEARIAELRGTALEPVGRAAGDVCARLVDDYRRASATEAVTTCHGDAHAKQVVRLPGRVALIDFDRTGDGPALSDLGRAWCWARAGHLPPRVWRMLENYQQHAPAEVIAGSGPDDLDRRVGPFGRLQVLRQALALSITEIRGEAAPRLAGTFVALERLTRQ